MLFLISAEKCFLQLENYHLQQRFKQEKEIAYKIMMPSMNRANDKVRIHRK